jgi:ribonuclease-3
MNSPTLCVTSSTLISDKQSTNENYEYDVKSIVQKQIEDDLATHDFTKPHVTREDIQGILQMKIKNIAYYQRALVHKSIHKSIKKFQGPNLQEYLLQHNERMELLGDSVLSLVVIEYLYDRFSDKDEGFLTRLKIKLVNGVQLAKLARSINLGKYILTSNHVQNINGKDSTKILEDCFEAFLAAIHKDLGYSAVYSFCCGLIDKLDFNDILVEDNFKEVLLKYTQHHFNGSTPTYEIVSTEGPPHNRIFTVIVVINGKKYSEGTAKSKKQAEQIASENTLKLFSK